MPVLESLRTLLRSPAPAPTPGLSVWMDPSEYSQLLALFGAVRPQRVLEWGAGGSTQELLRLHPYVRQYVSIEHDAAWAQRVRDAVLDPRLHLAHVPSAVTPPPRPAKLTPADRAAIRHWERLCETDPDVMRDYVAYPATLNTTFDFVLVDGRARVFCLQEGYRLLRPGGVIVVHDAERTIYHSMLRSLGDVVFLQPWSFGQIAFVHKTA